MDNNNPNKNTETQDKLIESAAGELANILAQIIFTKSEVNYPKENEKDLLKAKNNN